MPRLYNRTSGAHPRASKSTNVSGLCAVACRCGCSPNLRPPLRHRFDRPHRQRQDHTIGVHQTRIRNFDIDADDLIKQNPSALEKYRIAGIDPGTPQTSPALNDLVRASLKKGGVLDGYPATKDQADHLATLVRELGLPSPVVIQIDVPDEVVRERLQKRKGPEDTPEQVERRLKDYHRELDTIRDYYPRANIWTIDGTRSPADVSRTIQVILRDELPRRR